MAGPADAKVSASKKAQIKRQLKKAVKHNPKVVSKKWFLKKASLVNFKLPVTIRLRSSDTAANPNNANIDLGASLGRREIDLGGSLAAEIVFHDSYDGGALGNVDVNILPSTTRNLTSTSVPLLWNNQVSAPGTSYDSTLLLPSFGSAALLALSGHAPGCGDITAAGAGSSPVALPTDVPFGKFLLNSNGTPHVTGVNPGPPPTPATNAGDGAGLPGVPIYANPTDYANHATPVGFAPARVTGAGGFDNTIDAIKTSKQLNNNVLDNNNVGGNPDPFPGTALVDPTADGVTGNPTAKDVVLRTNALKLNVATPGVEINQSTNTNDGTNAQNGVAGSQNMVLGKSGGQANLFGSIPGKGYGIDVTVNLATRINSILRIVDQDAFEPLIVNGNWPAAVFGCGQVWTGGVQNYIPAVRLKGDLKIAPAITSDGHLRIAKATISSLGDPARVALSACLAPYTSYNPEVPANLAVQAANGTTPNGTLATSQLPASPDSISGPPAANCNAAPTGIVANSALPPATVQQLSPAAVANGYSPNVGSGAAVSVAGDLTVGNVSADILVGDVG